MPKNEETSQPEDDVVFGATQSNDPTDEKLKPKRKSHNMDNLLKRDMAFLQKKLAELEIAVSEVQEGVQKIDLSELSDLKQRLEDIEDLTMVENAGVIELKKMLEGTAAKAEPIAPQLEERLNALEQKISSITVPSAEEIKSSITSSLPATDTTKIDEKINEVRSGFESIKTDLELKIDSLQQKFAFVENNILQTAPNVEMLKEDVIKAVVPSLPDTGWIKNELHSFQSYLDAEKVKLESLTERLEKSLETPLPEKAVEELEKIRNDWFVNMAKIDAVEKFVENFSNEINQLKPIIKKLETFEKLMDLQTELQEKLSTFKEYREHVEKAIVVNEDIERRIQRDVSKIKNAENMLSRVDEAIATLSIDNKKDVDSLERMVKTMQEDMSILQGSLMALEQNRINTTASITELKEAVFRKYPKSEVADITRKIEMLEGEIVAIKTLKPDDTTNELVNKLNELEGKIDALGTSYDQHLSEIVSRLVFLESKLAAMESMSWHSAIVVE